MILILGGLAAVGAASILLDSGGSNAPHPLLGDVLVVAAQIIVAVQMVVEEKFIAKYNVPALLVTFFKIFTFAGCWLGRILGLYHPFLYFGRNVLYSWIKRWKSF
jgi:hypothetical protein